MINGKSKKTHKPLIGGILTVLSGAAGLLATLNYWIGFGPYHSGFGKGDIPPFVPSIIIDVPILSLVIALFAVAGGVFAFIRKLWTLSLIGSIAAALSFILLGVPAMILIILCRDEFS
jgi:hypothetical protein